MFPTARSKNLTVQEMSDETLVFDRRNHKAHCLNQTAALVWKLCDGRTSPAEMARQVKGGSEIVELALQQLASRNLLVEKIPRAPAVDLRSRRALLKKLAVALTLPAIMTVAAPRAARAASFSCKSNADCAALNARGGCQIGTCVSGQCRGLYAPVGTACVDATGAQQICDEDGDCEGGT